MICPAMSIGDTRGQFPDLDAQCVAATRRRLGVGLSSLVIATKVVVDRVDGFFKCWRSAEGDMVKISTIAHVASWTISTVT